MKKPLIALSLSSLLILAWMQRPVQAKLNEDTMKCLIQSVAHADDSFSEKEKTFLTSNLNIPPNIIEELKYDCMTPKKQLLQKVKGSFDHEDAIMIAMISAYVANADGVVHAEERALIEDFLEVLGKKRKAQPLLDICVNKMSEDALAKVDSIYGFGMTESMYKAKRSEVPQNLRAIKTAQMEYMQEFDIFIKCSAYPASPSKTTQVWTRSASGGFKTIDFAPNGEVRGSYMVSTTSVNFTAIGISDIDGDGVYATYIATKSMNPNNPITPPDVY